ncbi:DEAD/DEAH box helicase [Sorangium sp. So ce128]|uniref:DEAD/DEAH box helicase n=1 Tax=Sorangium sp. So ce128 TaxID=3133281 RepID=UPI003F6379F4
MQGQPKFKPRDQVQRTNASNEIGVVISASWNLQAEIWMYKVQLGGGIRGGIPESSLRPFVVAATPWDELAQGAVSGAIHFRHALTYHRVRRPPSRIAKSFSSARTRFYPHQFKPLLKFLDNPEKRILIGDDVGLGKTIEAGYILCELQAQQPLDQVLVLVPARLLRKWRDELLNRFGETFEIVHSPEIQAYLRRAPSQVRPFRWITSYETMRGLVAQLDESPVSFDLVILDEAHRARSPETQQHRLARLVCQRADAVVMLSATPVQNRLDDLWHLVRMLAPDEFSDPSLFEQQMMDNSRLLSVIRAIGETNEPQALAAARAELAAYFRSPTGRRLAGSAAADAVRSTLAKGSISRRERIELQSALGGLSPIAHVFTRTRKIDAIPSTARREASWVPIGLTELERTIYDRIEQICANRAPLARSEWARQRGLLMVYRALASCIPAALAHFAKELTAPSDLEEEEELEDTTQESSLDSEVRGALKDADRHLQRLGATDTKLAKLLDELRSLWREDEQQGRPPRKVVLFSFFRRTVEYLRGKLRDAGIECRAIHGGISPQDREAPIEDFLGRPDVRVLITSDVGGEGIDLQKASVLYNYDLPWNPMVVEQRIGRIDRIGQEAPVLVIRNFVVEDSIEERILKRLFDKIRVFEESIGELDPILGEGESVESLTEQALFGRLSAPRLEEILVRDAEVVLHQHEHARRLQNRVDELIAADQALLDEIDAVTGEHQVPSERHLLDFINRALASAGSECVIPGDATEKVVRVDLRAAMVDGRVTAAASDNDRTARFVNAAKTAPEVLLTFSRDAAYRHPGAEFIHSTHPLARWAVGLLETPRKAFRVAIPGSAVLPDGEYGFLVELLETPGTLRGSRMIGALLPWTDPGATPIIDGETVARVLGEVLEHGEDEALAPEELGKIDPLSRRLQVAMDEHIDAWEARERELHEARDARRRAAVQATHELALKRAEERLAAYRSKKHPAFALRMADAKVAKAREQLARVRSAAPKAAWPGYEREELMVGLLHVGKPAGRPE